jgi:hypothetical protein
MTCRSASCRRHTGAGSPHRRESAAASPEEELNKPGGVESDQQASNLSCEWAVSASDPTMDGKRHELLFANTADDASTRQNARPIGSPRCPIRRKAEGLVTPDAVCRLGGRAFKRVVPNGRVVGPDVVCDHHTSGRQQP